MLNLKNFIVVFVGIRDEEVREYLFNVFDDLSGSLNFGLSLFLVSFFLRCKLFVCVSIWNFVEFKNLFFKGIFVEISGGLVYCIIGLSGSGKVDFLSILL